MVFTLTPFPESTTSLDRVLSDSSQRFTVASKHTRFMDFFSAYQNGLTSGGMLTTAEIEAGLYAHMPQADIDAKMNDLLRKVQSRRTPPPSKIHRIIDSVRETIFGKDEAKIRGILTEFASFLNDVPTSHSEGVSFPRGPLWTSSIALYHPDRVVGISHDAQANAAFYGNLLNQFAEQSRAQQRWSVPLSHGLAQMMVDAVEKNEGFTGIPVKIGLHYFLDVQTEGKSAYQHPDAWKYSTADHPDPKLGAYQNPLFRRMRGKYAKEFCEMRERLKKTTRKLARDNDFFVDDVFAYGQEVKVLTSKELPNDFKNSLIVAPLAITLKECDATITPDFTFATYCSRVMGRQ